MRRFFYHQPNVLEVGSELLVTDDIFHHWCKVLRANVGEQAILFDGQGGEYIVTLTDMSKKQASVKVETYYPINRDLPFEAHIALVMSRGERMDYAIQKATELGVTSIQLLTSQHGEVRLKADQIDKKLAHWQQVAVAACEQCGLNIVPQLLAPMTFSQWLDDQNSGNQHPDTTKLILAVPNEAVLGESLNDSLNEITLNPSTLIHIVNQFQRLSKAQFCLLIGAEGGFSHQEVSDAIERGFLPWQIGERVLRTETAPVVALSSLLTLYQTFALLQDSSCHQVTTQ